MAEYGFSIFLGFFAIAIFFTAFVLLFSFRKHRENKKIYLDALFCGSMSLYLLFYYLSLNYKEAEESTTGDRNLLVCIILVFGMIGTNVAAVGYLFGGAFWKYMTTKPNKPKKKPKNAQELEREVRFDMEVEASEEPGGPDPRRERFFQGIFNKIATVIVIFAITIPVLYMLIDIFSSADADIIREDRKCWVGGNGALMYVLLYLPVLGGIISTAGFYAVTAIGVDSSQFYSAKPDNPFIRDIQLRMILVAGLGLWWAIEIPAIAEHSPAVVQHLNGFLNIPLAVLALYTFTRNSPEVLDSWRKRCPLALRAKKEVQLLWLYNVSRPAQKVFYRAKTARKKNSAGAASSIDDQEIAESPPPSRTKPAETQPSSSRPADTVRPVQPTEIRPVRAARIKPVEIRPVDVRGAALPEVRAELYSTGVEEDEYYAEFDSPNLYENERAVYENEQGPAPPPVAEYHGPDEQGYDNIKGSGSNVYVYKL